MAGVCAAPHSLPPRRRRTAPRTLDFRNANLKHRSFWAGWGGAVITFFMALLVVGLLVGWVLLWVNRPMGPNIALLVIGCVAFTMVLAVLGVLQARLMRHWRLSMAEKLFLTGISHSMRTPIGAIRAAAQALEDGEDLAPAQRQRLISAIIHETRRLGLRVDNVLETGRLALEDLAFTREPFRLDELLTAIADEHCDVLEVRGGKLLTDLQPATIEGDPRTLRLLVENLIDNAVKYSPSQPRVCLELRRQEGFARVRVIDHGVGFDEAEAPRLFTRFVRGDTNRKGTGLGLPLARAIARAHGGDVHLHSAGPGLGAVAEAWLPELAPET